MITNKERILPPVRPNAGTEAKYRRKLQALIEEMHASVLYWVKAAYKANEPVIAQDELPTAVLQRVIKKLTRRWEKRFDVASKELAAYFAQAANKRSAQQLQQILKEGGFSVSFKMTRAARDVLNASIAEQVELIRSIPSKYFTDIQGSVMRSVQTGRDLGTLTKELQNNYGVTYRRAALIARDQNNKATATITRVRQKELGLNKAVWVHSGGGKTPRPSHLAAGKRKQEYDINEGWFDPDEGKYIFPGELINCRCVPRAVIAGF